MNAMGQEIADYARELRAFIGQYDLPSNWFEVVDHVAFKYKDKAECEAAIKDFRKMSSQITAVHLNNRQLATAQLQLSLWIGDFGAAKWIEIMEPRPERVGQDIVGLEHLEFYYPNFGEITEALDSKGVLYEIQSNPGHNWVNIVINSTGQELKLNDRMLGDVVAHELVTGESHVI